MGTLCLSAIVLAACGDDQTDAGDGGVATVAPVATTAGTDPDGTDPDSTAPDGTGDVAGDDSEAPTDPDEAFELFNECMADQGFDIDAKAPGDDEGSVSVEASSESGGPEPGGGPVIMGPGGVRIDPEDAEDFQAANETCSVHLANVENQFEMSPEQQAAMEDATLRIEKCMKEKGFDVHIQVSSGGSGPGLETHEAPEGEGPADGEPINPDDVDKDALEAATRECNKIFDEYDELDDMPVPGE
jgi:hypothetical protein